jgi:hypothetical protein
LTALTTPNPEPSRKALIALDRGHTTTEDDTYRALIHEVGHTLGFAERYGKDANDNPFVNRQFENDFMGNNNDPGVGMHAAHREAAARFGDYVSNGRDVRNAAIRDFRLDATDSGQVEQFFPSGARNPDYENLQSRLRTDNWIQFRRQLAPPPPPIPLQIFGRPPAPGRGSRVQIFPGWNPNTPQVTPIITGSFNLF